jgi:uncharacterized protein YbaA (DUF1428 family)
MSYVDGFLIPVPKKSVAAYRKIAKLAAKVWREHGALDYKECVGDDLNMKFGVPFTKLAKAKPNETIIFAYIVFKSRAHRDRVNAKVMKDPRMDMDPSSMPFDIKRMSVGGFKTIVEW